MSILAYPKVHVLISILQQSDESKETAALLELIYNGEKTIMLSTECENLRNRVLKELINMQEKMIEYEREPDSNIKHGYRQSIIMMINRSSAFAAFKRGIIRSHAAYMREFGEYLT